MNQTASLLSHLGAFGSISPAEAREVYGIQRLAARVLELRDGGWCIDSERRHDARGHRYTRYHLVSARPFADRPIPA